MGNNRLKRALRGVGAKNIKTNLMTKANISSPTAIWTLKLNIIRPEQRLGGWSLGNSWCCSGKGIVSSSTPLIAVSLLVTVSGRESPNTGRDNKELTGQSYQSKLLATMQHDSFVFLCCAPNYLVKSTLKRSCEQPAITIITHCLAV